MNLPLCDENAEVLGFGGSFGVVSPGEKLGDVFALKKMSIKYYDVIILLMSSLNSNKITYLGFRLTGGADVMF